MKPIYFDNAATTFPKPDAVVQAVTRYLTQVGANPGRGSHARAIDAGRIIFAARRAIAKLTGAADPMRVILTSGATFALNTAICGLLREGGHCVTTSMEHNAVLRPLTALAPTVETTIVQADSAGRVNPDDIRRALRPDTKLVAVTHASNVNGAIQDVAPIGELLRDHPAAYLVDAAQSAGSILVDIAAIGANLLAIAGHKGPLGPTGTGALVLGESFDINRMPPLMYGGTGSRSSSTTQPDFLPDRYEAGTLNVAGFAGLAAGVNWVLKRGVEAITAHEQQLRKRFILGARDAGLRILGDPDTPATGVVALTIPGMSISEAADTLTERYHISSRQGLHCAPLAHETLGSAPDGALRFGFGPFNTLEEIDVALDALKEMFDCEKET